MPMLSNTLPLIAVDSLAASTNELLPMTFPIGFLMKELVLQHKPIRVLKHQVRGALLPFVCIDPAAWRRLVGYAARSHAQATARRTAVRFQKTASPPAAPTSRTAPRRPRSPLRASSRADGAACACTLGRSGGLAAVTATPASTSRYPRRGALRAGHSQACRLASCSPRNLSSRLSRPAPPPRAPLRSNTLSNPPLLPASTPSHHAQGRQNQL